MNESIGHGTRSFHKQKFLMIFLLLRGRLLSNSGSLKISRKTLSKRKRLKRGYTPKMLKTIKMPRKKCELLRANSELYLHKSTCLKIKSKAKI